MIIRNKLRRVGSESGRFAAWIIIAVTLPITIFSFSILGFIVGLLFIAIPVFLVTAFDGIEVNADQFIYRKITSLFGLHFGRWESLPDLNKISVLETTGSIYASSSHQSMTATKKVFILRLHPVNTRVEKIVVGRYPDHASATKDATYLAEKFKLEVVQQKH